MSRGELFRTRARRAKRIKGRRVPGTSRVEEVSEQRLSKPRSSERSIALDALTAKLLIKVARTWRVSETEAVRRALEVAKSSTLLLPTSNRLEAFHELQKRLNLTPTKAIEWQNAVRDSRR